MQKPSGLTTWRFFVFQIELNFREGQAPRVQRVGQSLYASFALPHLTVWHSLSCPHQSPEMPTCIDIYRFIHSL
jgi:hypothetical protein